MATITTYNKMTATTKEERFISIFNWVTTSIKNSIVLQDVKKALRGDYDYNTKIEEIKTIGELAQKGFINRNMAETLIGFAKVA